MPLQIDPTTDIGKEQIRMIRWAQDQMNEVFKQYFNNQHKLLKGLRLEFRIPLDGNMSERIKVDVLKLVPTNKEDFDKALDEVKKNLGFPYIISNVVNAEIIDPRKVK